MIRKVVVKVIVTFRITTMKSTQQQSEVYDNLKKKEKKKYVFRIKLVYLT